MSIASDRRDEKERIARQAAIKAALEVVTDSKAELKEQPKADGLIPIDQTTDGTIIYRKLKPWESRDARGRVFQYRPMTSREAEAENDRLFMESQRRQDEKHAARVAEAIDEAAREQKRLDKAREKEIRTGRRPLRDPNRCSLEEARRRGLIGVSPNNNGKPEWWSSGNPDGIMGAGR